MLLIEGRTLKDRHLVQGRFLEEELHEHLRSELGLGIGGGGGLHFNQQDGMSNVKVVETGLAGNQ